MYKTYINYFSTDKLYVQITKYLFRINWNVISNDFNILNKI